MSGRYVIVQMDNGEDVPLNLKEVRVYGQAGRRLIKVLNSNDSALTMVIK